MKEINNQIGPNIEQLWNVAMQVLHNILGFVLNTTAYHMGRYSCHLLLLKSSMVQLYVLQVNIIYYKYFCCFRCLTKSVLHNRSPCSRMLPLTFLRCVLTLTAAGLIQVTAPDLIYPNEASCETKIYCLICSIVYAKRSAEKIKNQTVVSSIPWVPPG